MRQVLPGPDLTESLFVSGSPEEVFQGMEDRRRGQALHAEVVSAAGRGVRLMQTGAAVMGFIEKQGFREGSGGKNEIRMGGPEESQGRRAGGQSQMQGAAVVSQVSVAQVEKGVKLGKCQAPRQIGDAIPMAKRDSFMNGTDEGSFPMGSGQGNADVPVSFEEHPDDFCEEFGGPSSFAGLSGRVRIHDDRLSGPEKGLSQQETDFGFGSLRNFRKEGFCVLGTGQAQESAELPDGNGRGKMAVVEEPVGHPERSPFLFPAHEPEPDGTPGEPGKQRGVGLPGENLEVDEKSRAEPAKGEGKREEAREGVPWGHVLVYHIQPRGEMFEHGTIFGIGDQNGRVVGKTGL